MGSGGYSHESYANISTSRNYAKASIDEIFNDEMDFSNSAKSFNSSARSYNNDIDQKMVNVGVRECRDSEEHPNTTPIIIAFDVTGSEGRIPFHMVKEYFPAIMDALTEANVPDPQVMFMAFGDHYTDSCPLQAGQFEADTEKIVNSLQSLYLERGGGGNDGESPSLAYLIAGYHTECDSWYKRHKKGFMFTISDEKCHPTLEGKYMTKILGYEKGIENKSVVDIINKAKEQYHVFHIFNSDGCYRASEVVPSWKELLGDHVITCKSTELLKVIPQTILKYRDSTTEESVETTESAPVRSY